MDLLKSLCELSGVSGYEDKVMKYLLGILRDSDRGEAYTDTIGNVIFFIRGSDSHKKVLIQAHADEVGFQVISQIGPGQYSIKSLGNIKTWNAYQQRVVSSKGTPGVIYARNPDQLRPHNFDNLILQVVGPSDGVSAGEVFSFLSPFLSAGDCYAGKALDDRLSCCCLLETIRNCGRLKNDTYICFTVQEEIGMRGARVLKSSIRPDVSISVDLSGTGERNSLKMGNGVGIKLSDSLGVSSKRCVELACAVAASQNIPYQLEASDCGTSELIITNELDNGSEELGISIPCEHLHCANTIVRKSDLDACIGLLPGLLERI